MAHRYVEWWKNNWLTRKKESRLAFVQSAMRWMILYGLGNRVSEPYGQKISGINR